MKSLLKSNLSWEKIHTTAHSLRLKDTEGERMFLQGTEFNVLELQCQRINSIQHAMSNTEKSDLNGPLYIFSISLNIILNNEQ